MLARVSILCAACGFNVACTEPPLCVDLDESVALGGAKVEAATFLRETFSTRVATRVDASGKATYQESTPDVPDHVETFTFQLLADEQQAVNAILDEPRLLETAVRSELPCDDSDDFGVKLKLDLSDGTSRISIGLLSCLASPQTPDMGQAGYQVSQLFALHRTLAIEHLECPHPKDSSDGLRESAPDGLGVLCSWVWMELENDEQIACKDDVIARGVVDCH
jgi:hypothetical protein